MGDLQEEKSKTSEKSSNQDVPTRKSENKPEQELSISKIVSEEKLEKLYEIAVSNISVQLNKTERVSDDKAKKDKGIIEEQPLLREEEPVPKEDSRDEGQEEPATSEDKKLENQKKFETIQEKQIISNSVVTCAKQSREKIVRNQSDIFSLKDIPTTLQTSIFSVNGCPSRKVFRKQEPAGHLFQKNDEPPADKVATPRGVRITKENYNDEKRPSSSYRNPLTGSGLSSNDEYKSKGNKRKDGNPLLGLGYDTEVVCTVSQHRIPPGGYSHKLW